MMKGIRVLSKILLVFIILLVFLIPADIAQADGYSIDYGEEAYGSVIGSEDHDDFFFPGNRGDIITVSVEETSGDLDIIIRIWAKVNGNWIKEYEKDSSSGSTELLSEYELKYDAEKYVVQVSPYGDSWGNFRIALILVESGSTSDDGSYISVSGFEKDVDGDGLSDDLEQWLIDTFKPYVSFDEEEGDCISNLYQDSMMLYQVSPYTSTGSHPLEGALITVVFLFSDDCGPASSDFLSAFNEDIAHPGDAELMRIFVVDYGDNVWDVYKILIKRHHDSIEMYGWNEFGFYSDSHPVIYISESKHAIFSSYDECEDYSMYGVKFEDCYGGPTRLYSSSSSYNVGERGAMLFDSLSDITSGKFSSEYAFTNYPFCGGFTTNRKCGGALAGKWWPPVDMDRCPTGSICTVLDHYGENGTSRTHTLLHYEP